MLSTKHGEYSRENPRENPSTLPAGIVHKRITVNWKEEQDYQISCKPYPNFFKVLSGRPSFGDHSAGTERSGNINRIIFGEGKERDAGKFYRESASDSSTRLMDRIYSPLASRVVPTMSHFSSACFSQIPRASITSPPRA